MGVIDAYRRLLRNGPLSRLLFGEFISSIGDCSTSSRCSL